MRRCVKRAAHRLVLLVLYVLLVLLRCLGAHFTKATETQGMGTSPFGPAGLSTVPIPCVSSVSREAPIGDAVGQGAALPPG